MVVHPDLAQVGHSIEDQIRFQHFTPGPNTYNPVLPPKKAELPNGLIKDSRPPAPPNEDVPGPGAYGDYIYPAGHIPLPDGGRVYHHSRDKVGGYLHSSSGLLTARPRVTEQSWVVEEDIKLCCGSGRAPPIRRRYVVVT